MKVEKTRKLYKRRRHNKELKRARQPWNNISPDNQESSDDELEEKSSNEVSLDISPQSSLSNEPKISSEVIQFLNNPQTLLEFKQFQEYLKIKDTIRTRSNSATNELPKNTKENLPLTPPTTPTITKSKPSVSEIDFLTSIDEEDDFSETVGDIEEKMPSQRNNASF